MQKYIQVSGNRRQCIKQLSEFITVHVTKEKPALSHLEMIIEHACKLHLPERDSDYIVDFSIDIDSLSHTISATKSGAN